MPVATHSITSSGSKYIKEEPFWLRNQKGSSFNNKLLTELCLQEFAVQTGDMIHGNTLRALHFTSTGVGAVTKSEFIHLGHHGTGAAGGFRTSLRKQGQGADTGGDEQHGGTVLAGSNASAASDASRCIHALLGIVMRNQDVVGILGGTGTDGNETAGLKDLVECSTVDNQVLDYRETGTSPRLDGDRRTILKVPHEQLAGGHMVIRTMGTAVNIQGTGTANTFAAVMVKGNRTAALAAFIHCHRIHTLTDQLLIENIEHFQEGSILFDTGNMISLEMSLGLGVLLTPYLKIEFHLA